MDKKRKIFHDRFIWVLKKAVCGRKKYPPYEGGVGGDCIFATAEGFFYKYCGYHSPETSISSCEFPLYPRFYQV
jgi:hypothetical protein